MSGSIVLSRTSAEILARLIYPTPAALAVHELRSALERSTPWERAEALIAELRQDIGGSPSATHGVDQMQAYITARLRVLELDVTDERVLYEAFCLLALVRECARNGRHNEILDPATEDGVATVCRAIATALVVLVPREVGQ